MDFFLALINDAANSLARTDVNSKKRHRRVKSNHKSDQNKDEGNIIELIQFFFLDIYLMIV